MSIKSILSPSAQNVAIIAAAGQAARMQGKEPKQFRSWHGRPVLWWSASILSRHSRIGQLLIAVPPDRVEQAEQIVADLAGVRIIAGKPSRTETVRAAMEQLVQIGLSPEYVLVHDAARPGLAPEMVDLLLDAMPDHDGVAPALPIPDALIAMDGNGRMRGVDRAGLYRVQTPQCFGFAVLLRLLRAATAPFPPDEMSLLRDAGLSLHLVRGDHRLGKITWEEDLIMTERLVGNAGSLRVGTGFDIHAFAPGSGIILCGVSIPFDRSLSGHSDADLGLHALTDAILGALGAGDIGEYFPPSDRRWRNADSAIFLTHARDLAHREGYSVINADLSLICQEPRLQPYRAAMRDNVANILQCEAIGIKATTMEGLGAIGRGEGIAAQAVILLGR